VILYSSKVLSISMNVCMCVCVKAINVNVNVCVREMYKFKLHLLKLLCVRPEVAAAQIYQAIYSIYDEKIRRYIFTPGRIESSVCSVLLYATKV
jgi:hypothetical protein